MNRMILLFTAVCTLNSVCSADSRGSITVHAAGRGNPWINLRDGRDLPTRYTTTVGLQHLLEHGLVQPTTLASGDFDEDGVPDLISGYAGPSGGIITLHRGNIDSLFPNSAEAQQRRRNGALIDSPFLPEAQVFELPEAPDFVGAGDFDADGHLDVVAAARGGNALWLLPGDERGSFGAARRVHLPGRMTTLMYNRWWSGGQNENPVLDRSEWLRYAARPPIGSHISAKEFHRVCLPQTGLV